MIDFRILGPLDVALHGTAVSIRAPKQQALLVTLLLHANHEVALDELFVRLWDEDPPAAARAAMHVHVARLRALLEDRPAAGGTPGLARIRSVGGGYLLETPPETIDLSRFRDLAARATMAQQAGDMPTELAHLRAALAEWRGAPTSLDVVPSLAAEVAPLLVEDRLRLVERRLQVELFCRPPAELAPELRALVSEHPLRERFWCQLILALYHSGHTAEAAAAYHEVRTLYLTRLGIRPGHELETLYRRLFPRIAAPTGAGPLSGWRTRTHLPQISGWHGGPSDVACEVVAALTQPASDTALPIVCLVGPPCPGRAAEAIALAHRLRSAFPDGQWYIRLTDDAGRARDPADVLTLLLRLSGTADTAIPEGRQARANIYRARLADRRVLLVLDEAQDAEQIRDLLPGTARCAVIAIGETVLPELVALHSARPVQISPARPRISTGPPRHTASGCA